MLKAPPDPLPSITMDGAAFSESQQTTTEHLPLDCDYATSPLESDCRVAI
jgi:hypothetical protein